MGRPSSSMMRSASGRVAIANHQGFRFGGSSQGFAEGPVQVEDSARGIGDPHEIRRGLQDGGEQTHLLLDPLALGNLLPEHPVQLDQFFLGPLSLGDLGHRGPDRDDCAIGRQDRVEAFEP